MKNWEQLFQKKAQEITSADDPSHDYLHLKRVVITAKMICEKEGGNPMVVIPAAYFHDFVVVPKNSELRSKASALSAKAAIEYLQSIDYPSDCFEPIAHAIHAHSFSANIHAETLEAKIVQDADRLDGIGAIGVARCFATAGTMRRTFYEEQDPFCENRMADDSQYTIDHFYQKLFKTAQRLHTHAAKVEGEKRASRMRDFLALLSTEIR